MNNIQDMTNSEFVAHIMEFGSKHGALVQMVVMDCLQRGLDHYIEAKDEILEYHENGREGISLINMKAWVECCEETKQRIEDKYNPTKELVN